MRKLTVPQVRLLERLAARKVLADALKGDPWETLDHVDRRVAIRLAEGYGLVDVRVGMIAKITDRGREALAKALGVKS